MTLLLLDKEPVRDWNARLGFSRDELTRKVLSDEWFGYHDRQSIVYVEGLEDFGLKMSCFASDALLQGYKMRATRMQQNPSAHLPLEDHPRFEVVFDYFKRPWDMRIRNIFFESLAHQGLGKKFLNAVALTALDLNCHNIYVEPGIEGSVYWPSRGAQIQYWPMEELELEDRAQALIQGKRIVTGNWTQNDIDNLRSVFRLKDVDGLNRLFDLENVYVFQKIGLIPLRRYLFEDIPLGECVFDFDHNLTQQRLLRHVGIDLIAERAARGFFVPEQPGGCMGSPRDALTFVCR